MYLHIFFLLLFSYFLLLLTLNETCLTDVSSLQTSPDLFCAKDRTRDVDAIFQVIQSAKTFIFISVTDYLPLVSRTFRGTTVTRYFELYCQRNFFVLKELLEIEEHNVLLP